MEKDGDKITSGSAVFEAAGLPFEYAQAGLIKAGDFAEQKFHSIVDSIGGFLDDKMGAIRGKAIDATVAAMTPASGSFGKSGQAQPSHGQARVQSREAGADFSPELKQSAMAALEGLGDIFKKNDFVGAPSCQGMGMNVKGHGGGRGL